MFNRLMMFALAVSMTGMTLAATLFFAGDSTLHPRRRQKTDKPAERVLGSWGDEVEDYVKQGVVISNHAQSGASTLSFINSGRWKKLVGELKPGDWVLIEFGHNDQKVGKKGYYTAADADFRDNLRMFAKDVRAKGANPVFASPIVRRVLDKNGKVLDHKPNGGFHLYEYGEASRAVAKELDIPFVDMNALTKAAVESAGPEKSLMWYRAGLVPKSKDLSHPCLEGARTFAKLFVDDVKARKLPVAELLK